MRLFSFLAFLALASPCFAQVGAGPLAMPPLPARIAPQDRAFPGTIDLAVDVTDTDHKVMRVRESVPVPAAGPMTLLYPRWETASHAPTGSVGALAGLEVSAGGQSVPWHRDPVNVFAFHLDPPPGATRLDLEFQFISPTRQGALMMTPDIVVTYWQDVVLYPAGWYARDIPVRASLRLPSGFSAATSLDRQSESGSVASYAAVSLETLVDSPVYAGRWSRRVGLGAVEGAPVSMDLVADARDALAMSDGFRHELEAMVQEAARVFGPPHFRQYTFLVSLSDALPSDGGTEHLRSSENNFGPDYLLHPNQHLMQQDLLAHEFVHSWNGKFRTSEGLWTPDFNTPARDSLLWIYEGQTQYWGIVLAARAGLRTRQETLDLLAITAANAQARTGRSWKALGDSALDPVYDAGHHTTWPDWQGREDYYAEGVLLWLDVDTLIRERTGGQRSLDDFARSFFGVDGRSETTRTYTLPDVCAALARIAPMNWRAFFAERLEAHDDKHLLDGLRRGGYRLVYTNSPTATFRQAETAGGGLDLRSSLGLFVGQGGAVLQVVWEGAAFRAGIGIGARLTSINGLPYSDAALLAGLRDPAAPVRIGFRQDGRDRASTIDGAGPPRYPHLERIAGRAWLDESLAKREAGG
jgi:predicted metalloprotease with PDZ domain